MSAVWTGVGVLGWCDVVRLGCILKVEIIRFFKRICVGMREKDKLRIWFELREGWFSFLGD